MEDIKDRLGEYKYNFFTKLQNYLETELYFYGSIKRVDYISNSSDIDIIVITDNVKSMLSKIQTYLVVGKDKTQKIFQQHSVYDKGIITGYKIKYGNNENNIEFDLLVYDEKYRNVVLQNIYDINNLPFYIITILYILKMLYYKLHFISRGIYNKLKCHIFACYFNGELRYYNKEHAQVIMLDGI
jgi:predicted nucleotidyltransferase